MPSSRNLQTNLLMCVIVAWIISIIPSIGSSYAMLRRHYEFHRKWRERLGCENGQELCGPSSIARMSLCRPAWLMWIGLVLVNFNFETQWECAVFDPEYIKIWSSDPADHGAEMPPPSPTTLRLFPSRLTPDNSKTVVCGWVIFWQKCAWQLQDFPQQLRCKACIKTKLGYMKLLWICSTENE